MDRKLTDNELQRIKNELEFDIKSYKEAGYQVLPRRAGTIKMLLEHIELLTVDTEQEKV